jgi:glycosyltransferase involved in cell wall biosynthesis
MVTQNMPLYRHDSRSTETRVTVVIPCFKQEVFLFECLNSLAAQTMPAWEAVVVDDCSPAKMVDRIVSSYNDPRISSIRHDTNLGLAASRNTGLQARYAPFSVCIDADDFLHPEYLSATLDAIERQGADCVYTDFQLVGLSNDLWRLELKSADELARAQWVPGPGVLMRRSVWERVGGYSEELRWNEDWDFWIGAMAEGCLFERVPRPLYFYRRHAHTMTGPLTIKNEWVTRDFILKKRAAFFAVGNRARTFRTGGLVESAYAHRALGHRWQPLVLTARAVAINPKLMVRESKATIRRKLRLMRQIERKVKSKIRQIGRKCVFNRETNEYNSLETNALIDWDSYAPVVHKQYGHLSHDFPVLEHVIDNTEPGSVLEIGCGSGRLVPVYLVRNLPTIWLQDVSERALDLCRQRFFCQQQIRYFQGKVQSIPVSAAPDLIVANRVLQHILEDGEFKQLMKHLTSIGRYFYINEAGVADGIKLRNPCLKGRDYVEIFDQLGWHMADRGELSAEHGTRQSWMLFAKPEK